jgi:dTDP-glucose 4,6-dehydratase
VNDSLLITGGAGFIGANFVHYWSARHPQARLTVLDALTYAGNRASLRGLEGRAGFRFVHGDIRDRRLVAGLLREEQIDTIVHFAAETHVDRSIAGPDPFLDTNVLGTHSLLRAASEVWLDPAASRPQHRFHHISTDEVYGTLALGDAPFRETTPYDPSSPYAASKAAADHLVRAYRTTYGLRTTISNCSNNYGPFHFPEKLIPLLIVNMLDGRPLPVYGQGANVRDWLHVEDHCRGIELVLTRGRDGESYNIGGGNEQRNIDVVRMLCAGVDALFAADAGLRARFPACPASRGASCTTLIEFVRDRPGHDLRYAIDAGKIGSELGFRPVETMETGIARTLRWYLDNEDWWRALQTDEYRRWIDSQYRREPAAGT